MNAQELLDGLTSLAGTKDAGAANGVLGSRLVNGVEYAHIATADDRKMRAAWKRRRGGGAVPLLLITDDPEEHGRLRVLGPQGDGPIRVIRAETLLELVSRTLEMKKLEAIRQIAQEVDRLDISGVAGLSVRGLGSEHLYGTRLPRSERWAELRALAERVPVSGWREALEGMGYSISGLPRRGYLASAAGKPVICVHPKRSADQFARLDEAGRLPEGALVADCLAHGAGYGMLAAGARMRLLRVGREEPGAATRYLELDAATLEPDRRALLGLLAPPYLADGQLETVLREARDYGSRLRLRVDRALREHVLPVLGQELGRWAVSAGRDVEDDGVRAELEAAALTFVFRALFLLYAESAGYLPMSNHTYAQRSFTRVAERAAEELEVADRTATTLWRDIAVLVDAMRTGQTAWGVPPYNGALFAHDGFDGAEALESASIPDAALAPALVALARDPDDPEIGVDFSGLEIGHLGHIYEGLLSLRLSVADRDYRYEPGSDRYVPASAAESEIPAGELLWLTNEGGRKGGGVYYTRTELVRHLVREAVRPAFAAHLDQVRALAGRDPRAAAKELFEFFVLDPACGSAHFLVEVLDELAGQIAKLHGELSLPAVREQLDSLRAAAGATFATGIEDTALLKRLVLKRCVYGVDLSPMGAEIAKVSLWLGSFVPGLSLAYLDHNVQVGNSLIGVARPEVITPPGDDDGQLAMFGDALAEAVGLAAEQASRLREMEDRTPREVEASEEVDHSMREQLGGAERVLDLWTAQPLGVPGTRQEALQDGAGIMEGQQSLLADRASAVCRQHRALHWPLAFAEVFARDRPGFDVVVGNPPWEEVTVEELAFYGRYRPGLRSLPERQRKAELEKLGNERPELAARLSAEQARLAALRNYLGPQAGYVGSAGDPDTYKLFCQRYRILLRSNGALGVVLPRSAFSAKGSQGFRKWLFEQAVPRRIDFLLNSGRWAFDAEPRYTSALLAAERREPSAGDVFEVAGVAGSARAFLAQSTAPGLRLARSTLSPELEIPLLPNQKGADLLAKIRQGDLFPFGAGGRWSCFSVYEFHETHDSHLWAGATDGWPLWKGESFEQYAPLGRAIRTCPTSDEVMRKVLKVRPGAGSRLVDRTSVEDRRDAVRREVGNARVVYRRVTRGTDSRTIIACLIPPEVFIAYTGPYLAFVSGGHAERCACLGVMNSLTFDWQARRYVEVVP